MAKRPRKLTPDERAVRAERDRFINEVIADVARRAGIENTPEARARYIEDVLSRMRRGSSS